MKKTNDLLRLGYVAAGAVFLFNPTIHIIDPMPDFIGYWLIAYGLTYLAYLSERIASARKSFVYLAMLTAVKTGVCFAVPMATDTFTTLMAFSFAVAEAVLFIPAVSNLFEGLVSTGTRFGSKGVFRIPVGVIKALTIIAFIVKAVSSVVPTLPNLMLYGDTLFVTSGQIDWSNYVGLFYVVGWISTLNIGIPWLVLFIMYFKNIIRDTAFTGLLYKRLEADVLSDTGRLIADKMKKVMILSLFAVFFTLYIPIDYVNAFPNLITAGFIIAALVYLLPEARAKSIAGIVTASLWAILSGIGEWLQFDYRSNNYDPGAAVAFDGEGRGIADELYFRMELFSYVEALFFLITALIFASVFMRVLSDHISRMPKRQDGLERDPKALKKCLLPVGISGGVVVLFNFGITFVTKYFTGIWLVNFVAVTVLFVFSLIAYYRLSDTVYLPLRRKF